MQKDNYSAPPPSALSTNLRTLFLQTPWHGAVFILYLFSLSLVGVWIVQQVLFPPGVNLATTPWEWLCTADEVTHRQCIIALGGTIHQGRYLIAVGGAVKGIIAIGQQAYGLVAVGWFSCGALFAAGVTAVACPGLVCGLVSFGGLAPASFLGLTLIKTPNSQSVLSYGFLNLPPLLTGSSSGIGEVSLLGVGGGFVGGGGRKKAKESPRVVEEPEEEGRPGAGEGHPDEDACRIAMRRQPQQQHRQQQQYTSHSRPPRFVAGA